jgi:hypothetical protein
MFDDFGLGKILFKVFIHEHETFLNETLYETFLFWKLCLLIGGMMFQNVGSWFHYIQNFHPNFNFITLLNVSTICLVMLDDVE